MRVIDADGKQIGVMDLSNALAIANKKGLDLVEVSPAAQPPVAKLLDFKRFLNERKKLDKIAKRESRSILKEIRISPNISDGDLKIKARRAKEFLEKGCQVKVSVIYRGREITHPEIGLEKINGLLVMLTEDAKIMEPPKRVGRTVEATLTPKRS